MTSAKDEILARIERAAVNRGGDFQRETVEPSSRTRSEIVEQFAEYAAEYRANVFRTGRSDLKSAIETALISRGSQSIVTASDFPWELRPDGINVTDDRPFDNLELDNFQAVLTTCAVAIAETGTIVLDAGSGQGRRAITLVPDHHVCVVYEAQVVDSVAEAVAFVASAVVEGRPLTWISGPSATSDIELERVEGVHGPRVLDVLLVKG